jgi:phosphate transport system permease protein
MTDAVLDPSAGVGHVETSRIKAVVQSRLKGRHAREKRFQLYGLVAIGTALTFLVFLLGSILLQGASAFWSHRLTLEVPLSADRIDRSDLSGANYDLLVADALLARLGMRDDDLGTVSSEVKDLISSDLGFQLLQQVRANPELIGSTVTVTGPVSDTADLFYKGEIKRSTPADERPLTDTQLAMLDRMEAQGLVKGGFNSILLTRSDSTEPEQAGVLGALVGSALMLLVTALLSIPVGVLAAVYLEEFAPKNRFTDLVEVNINNLAAVPSIVYGLLGLAVFINWAGLPRSTPLVGGLVLALMALPTVIIATRSSLKAVPPSIREAALGIGASKTQAVFHHVLPLAMPGVMTGAIISLAHAVGETAPLLMIGMVAFNPGVPTGFTDSATVLPVQVFIWENASERAFHERTAAAIIVLLVFMILMNAAAIVLRRRFERRW